MKSAALWLTMTGAIVWFLAFLALSGGAQASGPVFKSTVGCVNSGRLWIEEFGSEYLIHARDNLSQPDLDLTSFEGKRLRIDHGYLLPGDIYVVQSAPMVLGECR
jgi:hypothetical protein